MHSDQLVRYSVITFYSHMATENMFARHPTVSHLADVEVDPDTGYPPIAAKAYCGRTVHPAFVADEIVMHPHGLRPFVCKTCLKQFDKSLAEQSQSVIR